MPVPGKPWVATREENRERLLWLRRILISRSLRSEGREKERVEEAIRKTDIGLSALGFADELDIMAAEEVAFDGTR
jgi:hypothetical protein